MNTKNRLNNLRREMVNFSIKGFLITSNKNCQYISGFSGSNGYIFVTQYESYLFTDSRYISTARIQMDDWIVLPITRNYSCLSETLSKVNDISQSDNDFTLGFESAHISFDEYTKLKNEIGDIVSLEPITSLVESMRSIKDLEELTLLNDSVKLADSIIQEVLSNIKPGISEVEISHMIDSLVVNSSADGTAFPSIVATGLNSASPHHAPTDEKVKTGDSVLVDMGVLYKGYRSDISRTIFVGEMEQKFSEIYSIVLEAQMITCCAAIPGITGQNLDKTAREFIISKGYGDYFIHGLGHGIGLDIHEKPMIVSSSQDILDVGSVFTLEPGIYIPDWGGVRIEDIFIMEENGPKRLSRAPK